MKKITESNESKREGKKEKNSLQGERIITDPFGSWTGVSQDDIYAQPVQDVDDL